MHSISTVTSKGGFVVVKIANGVVHHLHRALLIEHSEYFKKALTGPWNEAKDGVVRLEDVESGAFNIFVDWLYTRSIKVLSEHDRGIDGVAQLNAIVLGDRLLAPSFTTVVREYFVNSYVKHQKAPPFEVITCAYSKLSHDKLILGMLVDAHVLFRVENESSEMVDSPEAEEELPHKFLLCIMHKYARKHFVAKRDLLNGAAYR